MIAHKEFKTSALALNKLRFGDHIVWHDQSVIYGEDTVLSRLIGRLAPMPCDAVVVAVYHASRKHKYSAVLHNVVVYGENYSALIFSFLNGYAHSRACAEERHIFFFYLIGYVARLRPSKSVVA